MRSRVNYEIFCLHILQLRVHPVNVFMKYRGRLLYNLGYSKTEVDEMNGFERRREMKMKSILLAAFELFTSRGIRDVGIAEIAKKAQVSQVSIYNFFDSKENLVRQAIFAYMDEKMSESEGVLESQIPFRQKLEKLLFISGEASRQSNPDFFRSAMGSDPLIRNLLEEYYTSRTEPFILRIVEQGQKEGLISPDLSIAAVRLYIRALQGVRAGMDLPESVILDLDALFFYGLQGEPQNVKPADRTD
jgi:AcrR family transcriptional regulator